VKKLFLPLAILATLAFAQPATPATSPADAPAQPVAEPAPDAPVETEVVADVQGDVETVVETDVEVATSPAETTQETVPAEAAASAQDAQAQACMGGGGIMSFLPMIAIIVIFYFLMIRPQQKQAKRMREMRDAFQVNDRVVTAGGIHGVITNLKADIVTVRIADNVKIDVDRSSLTAEGSPSSGDSCSTCK